MIGPPPGCGNGGDSVTSADIADGSVASADLADGSVTATKLGLTNTAYVAAGGGTALDNCDALIAVLAGSTGPALVVVGPGSYDCDDQQLMVPDGVHLKGAGRNATAISGAFDDGSGLQGLVALGVGASLSDLSVTQTGANASIAVSLGGASVDVEIDGVTLTSNPAASVSFALLVDGGEATVRASDLAGGLDNSGTANIVNSQLSGGAVASGASRCVGSYDASFTPLDGDCS